MTAASASPPPWAWACTPSAHPGARGLMPLGQAAEVSPQDLQVSWALLDPLASLGLACSPSWAGAHARQKRPLHLESAPQETGYICNFLKAQPAFNTGLFFQWKV